ncbi:PA-phosphatase [Sphingomonas spermidinifaciens]|uniref:PA-phosphatase n=1 Tax=Sphingomonas spermidinifaciens TaxID=1141889 RepID=A0A2A4B1R3_9SPHN|nr:phosphatase PAP2 family protein [Sphingomonas spermidinifaciens]PCD02010.1 PA-phosphatase [Sphingomonas spermidinifaciens]
MKMPKAMREKVAAVERLDLRVTRALAHHRHKPEVKAAGAVSEAADQPPLIALSAAVLVVGLSARQPAVARTGLRMLAGHTLATGIKTIVKRSIDRTRPDQALDHGYRAEPGDSSRHELSSFPSGHTAGAVAVAEAIAREVPAAATPLRLLALSVALVQLPRAKHFVSDVVAGAAIGWAGERAASAMIDRLVDAGVSAFAGDGITSDS